MDQNLSAWERKISFAACCDFFENISKEIVGARDGVKARRVQKLSKFLNQLRNISNEYGNHTVTTADVNRDEKRCKYSLFPVLRLMLPQLDKERSAYGIKETLLAKLFIALLQLGPNSEDAMKLKNYKAPKSSKGGPGDFASVLYSVVKDREYGRKDSCPNISDINTELDKIPIISATKGRAGPDGVEGILMGLFKRMSATQVKWLVRIILKDMHIGLGEKTILNTFHLDAQEFYDVNADLRKVAEVLNDPDIRRHEIEVALFDPFRPMLAARGDADMEKVVSKQMTESQFYIETKYDGERIQIHKDANQKYRFFSRNGNDFTVDFGESPTVSNGSNSKFCHYLHQALLQGSADNVILDGEICAYNKLTESVTQKGEHMSIRGILADDPLYQQCLFVYDILLLNDQVLTNFPLRQRLETLHNVLPKELDGRVHHAQRKIGSSANDLNNALNEAIDKREEGIMVKDPNGPYRPNSRGGEKGWLKIKPEYNNELCDSLDLIVLGGYYGLQNKSRKNCGNLPVTHFLLGALEKKAPTINDSVGLAKCLEDNNTSNKVKNGPQFTFHTFCRVGSGYSNKELFVLLQKLQPHFLPWSNDKKQQQKISAKGIFFRNEPKPDVWIEPKNSVVLQVKAAEIVPSQVYSVGYTLRFPRVTSLRDDKAWYDCSTLDEIYNINTQSSGKLAKRQCFGVVEFPEAHDLGTNGIKMQHDHNESRKKGAVIDQSYPVKRKKPESIPSFSMSPHTKNVVPSTSALSGRVIVIEPSSHPKYKDLKAKLEQIVIRHGGTVEQNVARGKTYCYIETAGTTRAKSVINSGLYDVVIAQWLIDCEECYRPFGPSDMIYTTDATDDIFRKSGLFDSFDDSYIENASISSLQYSMKLSALRNKSSLEKMGVQEDFNLNDDIEKLEKRDFPCNWKFGIFRSAKVYIDKYSLIGKKETEETNSYQANLAELSVTFYGGKSLVDEILFDECSITHVVTSGDYKRLEDLKEIRRRLPQGRKFRIVTTEWVHACVEMRKLIDDPEYEM